MKKQNYFFLFIGFILLILTQNFKCKPDNPYGPEPIIDFSQIYIYDTIDQLGNTAKLYDIFFYIADGDYDFGLKEEDTTGIFSPDSIYYNNLFVDFYAYKDGEWTQLEDIVSNFRIPYIPPEGLNPYFKAEIDFKLFLQIAFLKPYADSIKFGFYVVDKALHKSNYQETPAFSLDDFGLYIDTDTIIQP